MVEIFSFGSHSKIVQWHAVVRVLRVTKRFCKQTKFSKCQIQKKKLKRGPSLKENSGLHRVPGYATFGIVKVDYPGPWVFYLALSIIALPKSLRLFLKEIDRHRPCNRWQRHLSSETGGHHGDLLGLRWPNYFATFRPMEGYHFLFHAYVVIPWSSFIEWGTRCFLFGVKSQFRQPEPKTC